MLSVSVSNDQTHMQVSQAGCGWWVQCSYWPNQLPVLLRRGPRCHWEGGEAVVTVDQWDAQTVPGTHTRIHVCFCRSCLLLPVPESTRGLFLLTGSSFFHHCQVLLAGHQWIVEFFTLILYLWGNFLVHEIQQHDKNLINESSKSTLVTFANRSREHIETLVVKLLLFSSFVPNSVSDVSFILGWSKTSFLPLTGSTSFVSATLELWRDWAGPPNCSWTACPDSGWTVWPSAATSRHV